MKLLTLLLWLCLCAVTASAQSSRFVTFFVDATVRTNEPPCYDITCYGGGLCVTNGIVPCQPFAWGSNSVMLAENEVARVVTQKHSSGVDRDLPIQFRKEGRTYNAFKGDVIQGPALVFATVVSGLEPPHSAGFVTLELLPQSFPPDRTLVLPQGSNTVAVALECSTNLVHWTTATNGLYGSPDAAKFFRIRAER